MTPSKHKPVIEDSSHKHKDNWSIVHETSINAHGKTWVIPHPTLPVINPPVNFEPEPPPTIPPGEHGYLKTLCERMAYYCGSFKAKSEDAHYDEIDHLIALYWNTPSHSPEEKDYVDAWMQVVLPASVITLSLIHI